MPHDQPLKTRAEMQLLASAKEPDEGPNENGADLTAMFDEVNSLPADDPLRQPAAAAAMAANVAADQASEREAMAHRREPVRGIFALPDKVLSTFHANGDTTSVIAEAAPSSNAPLNAPEIQPAIQARGNGAVVVDAGRRVSVPEFRGSALRSVVEHADALGLRVETLGSGVAREQAPIPGTMVPPGTEVVVRFVR